jgi:thymidylate kinase
MQVEVFKTSWGNYISSYVQKQVIKRIGFSESYETIINEEINDILDKHHERFDEAYEIYLHCEALYNKTIDSIKNANENN